MTSNVLDGSSFFVFCSQILRKYLLSCIAISLSLIGVVAQGFAMECDQAMAPKKRGGAKELARGEKRILRTVKTLEEITSFAELTAPQQLTFTMADFLRDDEKNPFMLLGISAHAVQLAYKAVMYKGQREVYEPVYKSKKVKVYPTLTASPEMTGGRVLVGQENMQTQFVDEYLSPLARGERSGKFFVALGPAGSGKTEILIITSMVQAYLSQRVPDFFLYTYEWVNIYENPYLARLFLPTENGQKLNLGITPDLKRSPYTLLRKDIQQMLKDRYGAKLSKKLGFDLITFDEMIPKEENFVKAIFDFEYPEIKDGLATIDDLTMEEYVNTLSKYIRIRPRVFDNKEIGQVVNYIPEDPDFNQLFAEPDSVRRILMGGNDNPLAWNFRGDLTKFDGLGTMFDEYFRNAHSLLNFTLDLIQNGNLAIGGVRLHMNTFIMAVSNDESLAKAIEEGAVNAIRDRAVYGSARYTVVPAEIAKLAVVMIGINKFKMRKLGEQEDKGEMLPLDLELIFTHHETGKIDWAHGRYALYYSPNSFSEPILIAPYALETMALILAGTRIINDPKKLATLKTEIKNITARDENFANIITRLQIIMGTKTIDRGTSAELFKINQLLKEGEKGITNRIMATWFSNALNLAVNLKHNTLTPLIVDMAFQEMFTKNSGDFGDPNQREMTLNRKKMVMTRLVLPALRKEIQVIIGGQNTRIRGVYEEVLTDLDIYFNQKNPNGVITDDGPYERKIDIKRLTEILEVYRQVNGEDFAPGFIIRHLRSPSKDEPFPELYRAVQEYLTSKDTTVASSVRDILNAINGQNVDAVTATRTSAVLADLERYGHNAYSLEQLLQLWTMLNNQVNADN